MNGQGSNLKPKQNMNSRKKHTSINPRARPILRVRELGSGVKHLGLVLFVAAGSLFVLALALVLVKDLDLAVGVGVGVARREVALGKVVGCIGRGVGGGNGRGGARNVDVGVDCVYPLASILDGQKFETARSGMVIGQSKKGREGKM